MKFTFRFLAVLALLLAVVAFAAPAQAVTGTWSCVVSPGTGPVGTTFGIACSGFTPQRISNIYAVEPDGRASGLNIYGFFPTSAKADKDGILSFYFATQISFSSVPPGDYTFVVQELVPNGGGKINILAQIPITVTSPEVNLSGATLSAMEEGFDRQAVEWFTITGSGYVPNEKANVWITQPPATQCSGLGIDQLTLAALAGDASSLWIAPGTVTADKNGDIAFVVGFRPSACRGDHAISVRALKSGIGGVVTVTVSGLAPTNMNATVWVSPNSVEAIFTRVGVNGSGFPANTTVNCWFTRPDGRVLAFIDFNAKTDSTGMFSTMATLDDFPTFSSTEPGNWQVTCATSGQAYLGVGSFLVFGLPADP